MGSNASESLGIMHEHLAAFALVLTLCVYFLNSVEYFTLCEFFCLLQRRAPLLPPVCSTAVFCFFGVVFF